MRSHVEQVLAFGRRWDRSAPLVIHCYAGISRSTASAFAIACALNPKRDEFDIAYREGTMLMLTMHPHISGRRSRVVELEKLITYMKSKPGVWFATAEQIANYVKQQRSNTH